MGQRLLRDRRMRVDVDARRGRSRSVMPASSASESPGSMAPTPRRRAARRQPAFSQDLERRRPRRTAGSRSRPTSGPRMERAGQPCLARRHCAADVALLAVIDASAVDIAGRPRGIQVLPAGRPTILSTALCRPDVLGGRRRCRRGSRRARARRRAGRPGDGSIRRRPRMAAMPLDITVAYRRSAATRRSSIATSARITSTRSSAGVAHMRSARPIAGSPPRKPIRSARGAAARRCTTC